MFDSLLSITLFTVATITPQKPITEDMYITFSPISLDHHLLTPQKPITEDMYIIFSPISLDHHLLTNISVTE